MFKLMNLAILVAFIGFVSCEGPEGPEGPAGPKGDKGDTGATGADGADGADGATGADGQNGNANVKTINLLSTDITWTEGDYLGRVANTFTLTNDAVNADIIDHGVVLGYCKLAVWYQLPFTWESNDGSSREYVLHNYELNKITLIAYETNGVLSPDAITEYRFLLITDNTITGGKGASSDKDILSKLFKNGVDVSNYYEVMDYFGLDY
jgi:hypothetical protein